MGTSEFVLFCFYSAACRSSSKKCEIEKGPAAATRDKEGQKERKRAVRFRYGILSRLPRRGPIVGPSSRPGKINS